MDALLEKLDATLKESSPSRALIFALGMFLFGSLVSAQSIGRAAVGGISTPAGAEAAKIEVYSFQTTTLTDEQFLTGTKQSPAVTISGFLRIPPPYGGTDRLPAVV